MLSTLVGKKVDVLRKEMQLEVGRSCDFMGAIKHATCVRPG